MDWGFDDNVSDFFGDVDLGALPTTTFEPIDGFGPGDYSGGYTGQGDSVYWGPSDTVQQTGAQGDGTGGTGATGHSGGGPGVIVGAATVKSGFGPGYVVPTGGDGGDGVDINTQAGSEGDGTGSQSTGQYEVYDATEPTVPKIVVDPNLDEGYAGADDVVIPTEEQVVAQRGGTVELADLYGRELTPEQIFVKYYVPGEAFDGADAIMQEYDLPAPPGPNEYLTLQQQLTDAYLSSDAFNARENWMLTLSDEDLGTLFTVSPAAKAEYEALMEKVGGARQAAYGASDVASSGVDSGTVLTGETGEMGQPANIESVGQPANIESVYDGDSYHGDYGEGLEDLPELPEWRGTWRAGMKPGFEGGAVDPFETGVGPELGGAPGGIQSFGTPGPYQAIELLPLGEEVTEPSFLDTEPELGDGARANPMLLDDVPLESEYGGDSYFDLGNLDPGKLPPETLEAISEIMTDPANISMGADGIGWAPTSFTGFLQARSMDLAIGAFLMPIFNWIDEISGTPWVSRGIQGTLATIGLLVGGDPFGVIAAPIAWGVQEYMKQRQRLRDNNDPEQYQGKKFGYVREGDKWYPAILTSMTRNEGWVGSNHSEIRMAYGTEMKWKKEKGTDTWVPYFPDGTYHMKDFHCWDSEVDDPENEGGKEYGERVDPLRDFYFLTDDQTTEMLTGMAGGSTFIEGGKDKDYTEEEQKAIEAAQKAAYANFGVRDQVSWLDTWKEADKLHPQGTSNKHVQEQYYSQWGGYVDTLNDLRQSMDFMQDYRYSDSGQMQTSNFGENEFAGSRSLRDAVNVQGYLGTPEWADDWELEQGDRPMGWSSLMTQSMGTGSDKFKGLGEMKVLSDMYVTSMNDLYASQKVAGTSMGYNELYGKSAPDEWRVAYHEGDERIDPRYSGKSKTWSGQKYEFPLYEEASIGPDYVDPQRTSTSRHGSSRSRATKDNGWALYQDNTWKFGELDTAAQLHDAISLIEESGDYSYVGTMHYRNSDQRSFLAQKAYTRYLYAKIDALGGLDYLHSNTDPEEAFGKLPRDNDADRVQYNDLTRMEWGRNPMYSELDDANLEGTSWTTYPPPGRSAGGLDPTMSAYGGGRVDWEYVLHDSGILSNDPTKDPDYIAGRFQSVEDYNNYLDPQDTYYYDEVRGTYILPGEEDPSTTWNPVTERYEAPKVEGDPVDTTDKVVETDFFGGGWGGGDDADEDWSPWTGATGYEVDADGTLVPIIEEEEDAPFGYHKDGTPRKHPKKVQVLPTKDDIDTDEETDDTVVVDDTVDTYVKPPPAVPDHEDDHSDTERESRPTYHMDVFTHHDPTPPPTHIPQNIKVI
jgi:hypothetical protein